MYIFPFVNIYVLIVDFNKFYIQHQPVDEYIKYYLIKKLIV